jgi:cell division protein FtsI/penicillin-binding protein 2
MKKTSNIRLRLVLVGFAVLFLLLVIRLFYWQVVNAEDLKDYGLSQSTESLDVPASRGQILASDGFALATNKISYLVYANPRLVSDKDVYAQKLSGLLDMDQATISALLSRKLFWVRLESGLNDVQKKAIDNLHLDGIGFEQQQERFYPEASMAAQLIGFVGKDAYGNQQGYFGLEGYYNDQLEGRSGSLYVIKDALGNPVINDIRQEKKIDGRNLVLTLNRTIQYDTQTALEQGVVKYGGESGTAIVMDPQTGKVLAMAQVPNFDPQIYYNFPGESYVNQAVSDLYEPGSTFKVLVMSAAIDMNLVKPETQCNICAGPVPIDSYKIETWDNKYFPNTTMTDVIQHSDNTGMVFVGRKLGVNNLVSYLKNYGIDETTGIDLQGEVSGTMRPKDQWGAIDLATASFGQGISVTPIQLLTAVSAIANGGNLMRPYVVDKIITDDGKEIAIKPQVKRRVIKESTSQIMTWMMVNAVENGESKWTKIDGYKIAGKTGTAQIPVAGHYDPKNTNASFVGFFPADKPRFAILVIVNKPKTSIYGSETAAPIFFQIAQDLINEYNIPPSQ